MSENATKLKELEKRILSLEKEIYFLSEEETKKKVEKQSLVTEFNTVLNEIYAIDLSYNDSVKEVNV